MKLADDERARPGKHPRGWRDTAVRVTGPAVREFQTAFFDNWGRSAGTIPAASPVSPAPTPSSHKAC